MRSPPLRIPEVPSSMLPSWGRGSYALRRLAGSRMTPFYNENVATSASLEFPKIHGLNLYRGVPLSEYTRFGIGGPADVLVETNDEAAFIAALTWLRQQNLPH